MRLICTALMFCSIPGFAALDIVRDGDVVITMGAGSIGGIPGKLLAC